MPANESNILRRCLLAASKKGWRLFRNNVGFDPIRKIHYGLQKGSSDLIGLRPVTITEDMVGQTIAQFVAVECKTAKGQTSKEQDVFLDFINRAGGHAIVARSEDDIR